jgi:hypothetical protein
MAVVSHLLFAVTTFRELFAGDNLPWWWFRCGMASVPDGRRDRTGFLCV